MSEFEFYEHCDLVGYDIFKANTTNIDELKEICRKTDKCVAFNTLGYMKYKSDKIQKHNLFEGKGKGLYVFTDRVNKLFTDLIEKNKNYKLYVIVPYRNREKQLNIFVPYMNQYLKYLKINYEILVVEQDNDKLFNKGTLLNIGVKYLTWLISSNLTSLNQKQGDNIYICLHDIDCLPVKRENYYKPNDNTVNHLYGYSHCLGGVSLINVKDYLKVNGFSNLYEGWGYEDTDFQRRIITNGITIDRTFFSTRGHSFKELDDDGQKNKMVIEHAKINMKKFNDNIDCHNSGIEQLENFMNHIRVENVNILDGETSYNLNIIKYNP